jgi:hypothetical protein
MKKTIKKPRAKKLTQLQLLKASVDTLREEVSAILTLLMKDKGDAMDVLAAQILARSKTSCGSQPFAYKEQPYSLAVVQAAALSATRINKPTKFYDTASEE